MNELTLVSLLDWLYQDYSIIFLLCLLGSFTHDIYDTAKNNTKINVKSIISSSLICSILLSVVIDHLNKYSIDVKIAICFFIGMWSNNIIGYMINWNFVKKLFYNYLKNTEGTISKSISTTLDEIENDETNENNDKNKKD